MQFQIATLRQLVDVAVRGAEVNPCDIILALPSNRAGDDRDARGAKRFGGSVNIVNEESRHGAGCEVTIVGLRTEDLHLRSVW